MSQGQTDPISRLDRIPVWPYSNALLVMLGIGFFFAYFDITNVAYGLPVITKQFHAALPAVAASITSSLIGYIVGALITSGLSDAYGRRLGITVAILLYTLGSVFTTFSNSVTALVVWRAVVGLGIGGTIAQITTYLSELSPAKLRGKIVALSIFSAYIGLVVTPFAGLWLVPHFSWGWRVLLFIGALGGLVLLASGRYIVESPRWLVSRGKMEQAEAIISAAEDRARNKMGKELPPVVYIPPEHKTKGYPLGDLLSKNFIGYVILLVIVWFFLYIGAYSWLGLAPTLLMSHGYTLIKSITFLAISSVGYLFGAGLSLLIADRIERKYITLVACLVFGSSIALIGLVPSGAGILIFGFIANFAAPCYTLAAYPLTAEHFPTRVRSTAVGIADGMGHLGGAIAPVITLGVLAQFGFAGAFGFMGLVIAVAGILTIFTKRTTGKALTSIESEEQGFPQVEL